MKNFNDYARELADDCNKRLVIKIGSEVLRSWDGTL